MYPPFEQRRPDVAQANSCRDSKLGEQELEQKAVITVNLNFEVA
jgi:hypothetical protein